MPSMSTGRQQKSFHFEVKAIDDEKGLIEAHGSVFGNLDETDEIVDRGAFTRTIKNNKSRIHAGKAEFLATMLWNHDIEHFLPIGGWYDLSEDSVGLLGKGRIILETQLGRDVYTLIKEKVINQFSIGYDVLDGGAYRDEKGFRHLKEVRLWEISPVVFAANQEALLVGVKSMDMKSVCGNTSGPIGPRDESWDGARAKREIWAAAEKEDGSINASLAKKYFMVCDGDAQEKDSYSYPFWYVGSDPHISVGAVKAIAAALGGARGANAPDGLKGKVATLYNRINKKFPDAEQLTPAWEDSSGKKREDAMKTKDLAAHYNEAMAADLLEDWQDVYLCSLTCAMLDALKEGGDVSQTLDDFKSLIMTKFVPQAEDVDLAGYLEEHSSTYSSADYTMQYGSDSKPNYGGYMSSARVRDRKAGRAISATNADKIQSHVDDLHDMADTHMKAMKMAYKAMQDHTKAIHTAADDLATVLQGSEAAYGTDAGTPDNGQQEGKSATSQNARGTQKDSSMQDTPDEDEISVTIRQLRSLKVIV